MIDCTVDSATLIDALRHNLKALEILSKFSAIGISHVALGELLVGTFKQDDKGELLKVSSMVSGMTLICGDGRTSGIYARIRSELEIQGRMIPQNDIWIAASSIQAHVPLITCDEHFSRIHGLTLIPY
jgi:tRNA(fMet)-specific endonuclease VapC